MNFLMVINKNIFYCILRPLILEPYMHIVIIDFYIFINFTSLGNIKKYFASAGNKSVCCKFSKLAGDSST